MGKTHFIPQRELENLLRKMIFEREVFSPKCSFKFWKSAYENLKSLEMLINSEIKHWKVYDEIKQLYKITKRFSKKLSQKGLHKMKWNGASKNCGDIIQDYRQNTIPLIHSICENLEEDNIMRCKAEKRLEKIV